jgi:hypothetical protein
MATYSHTPNESHHLVAITATSSIIKTKTASQASRACAKQFSAHRCMVVSIIDSRIVEFIPHDQNLVPAVPFLSSLSFL